MATKTYTRTLFHDDLTQAKVTLYCFKNNKYTDAEPFHTIHLNGITQWDIVEGGEEAKACERVCDKDEYDEYLVLHRPNGDTDIYPNTKVAMFIL